MFHNTKHEKGNQHMTGKVSICKQLLAGILLFVLIALFSAKPIWAVSFTDDTGRTIYLKNPAKRIIPLYGAFLEMLFAIHAGHTVIARTAADSYFESAKNLPSVGTHMRPNIELIISMRPDLVIQTVSQRRRLPEMASIEEAGIPVAAFAPKDFKSIFDTMRTFGKITGHEKEAHEVTERLRLKLNKLKKYVRKQHKKYTVFFEVREAPLTAAGRNSIVQKILEAAGLENVVTVNRKLVRFNIETLIAKNPDYYIIQKGPMNRNPTPLSMRPHFKLLNATKKNRVFIVDEFLFSRPGPRCVDAVEFLVSHIYGYSPEI